jgi:hypothetical protein
LNPAIRPVVLRLRLPGDGRFLGVRQDGRSSRNPALGGAVLEAVLHDGLGGGGARTREAGDDHREGGSEE